MNQEKPMLELKKVCKTFYPGTDNEKKALQSLDLVLAPGDFVTIIGSNGAGKSTLFNAIGGSFYPDRGQIILDGERITSWPDHRRALHIGRIFQDPMKGTAPSMTIEENLCLAYTRKAKRTFFALNKRDRHFFQEVLSLLDMGLENRMKTKVGQLSGGQRQAVSLLMSTISTPKLLLLDEHTAALDPATGKKVLQITTELVARDRITTLMITHDIHSALSLGNRTIMMDDGRVILDLQGTEREQMTTERLLSLYSAESKKALTDRTLFALAEAEGK